MRQRRRQMRRASVCAHVVYANSLKVLRFVAIHFKCVTLCAVEACATRNECSYLKDVLEKNI